MAMMKISGRKTWLTIEDGGSDRWVDVAKIGDRAYAFVEVDDMWGYCGERECRESGQDRYVMDVSIVDLNEIPADDIASALRSYGITDGQDDYGNDIGELAVAEMCHGYGCRAPVYSGSHPGNVRALLREGRAEVRAIATDDDAMSDAMSRPCNAIGSTAAEYMKGDIYSAMQRGCEAGDPNAAIMAKMHGIQDDTARDVRPDDWLPYVMGYMDATTGRTEVKHSDIAPEYTRGYQLGLRVKSGESKAPAWIR